MRTPNAKCVICSKEFYRRPFEFKKVKEFCCRPCRGIHYKKNPDMWSTNLSLGSAWNKGMSKANGDNLLYGRPRSNTTKQLISEKLKQVLIKKGEYKECLICNKRFYALPSAIKRGCGLFCSRSCVGIHIVLTQKRADTDIELMMEDWLKSNGIRFEKQKVVEGVTVADFVIDNTVLYCDGDYWHSKPRTKQRDGWVDRQLHKLGYKVIRILGSDIRKGVRPIELLH